jgi:hypothetical protein
MAHLYKVEFSAFGKEPSVVTYARLIYFGKYPGLELVEPAEISEEEYYVRITTPDDTKSVSRMIHHYKTDRGKLLPIKKIALNKVTAAALEIGLKYVEPEMENEKEN